MAARPSAPPCGGGTTPLPLVPHRNFFFLGNFNDVLDCAANAESNYLVNCGPFFEHDSASGACNCDKVGEPCASLSIPGGAPECAAIPQYGGRRYEADKCDTLGVDKICNKHYQYNSGNGNYKLCEDPQLGAVCGRSDAFQCLTINRCASHAPRPPVGCLLSTHPHVLRAARLAHPTPC